MAVLLVFGSAVVLASGEPAERKNRQTEMERWATALGMTLGKNPAVA